MSKMHDAMLWDALDGQKVKCRLCAHECLIPPGQLGLCRVRQNVGGQLKTLNYEAVVAVNIDPIEKKPLFHFLPGSRSLSTACAGCNFQCEFCQNWQISQAPRIAGAVGGQAVSPEELVAAAKSRLCQSISYTYTEPTIFMELARDTGTLARKEGIRNVFVSNGYMTPAAVEAAAPWLDAINVDLKAFRDETYRTIMKARLKPVLTCLKELLARNIWVEVTTLVVPGMNDSRQELADIANFIAGELGTHVPWHVSRFHGDYLMTSSPSTPIATLEMAASLGMEAGLKYVYSGNVPGQADERTYCPACRRVVIDRIGFTVRAIAMKDGACGHCGQAIEGVWS